MQAAAIREKFLKFFEERGHTRVSSSSLIPEADPTLLFTNAGMVQFKDVFTGEETRSYTRATSSQKCVRAGGKHNDLENVGFTARHHTFFEMLGNFSFGDYFKEDAIDFAWTLITKELGLDTDRLWVTIHHSDDEAGKLWEKVAGVSPERIKRFGDKDNFWQMGETGPCGPCSEIHYDQGPELEGTLNGEGDRYLEIWNLVFMQYEQNAKGERSPLPKPSIDTGMGLERIAAILQGKKSNYDSDLFLPILQFTASLAGTEYGANPETDTSLRVIADHARATAFLITDGVLPSNVERGYVLRRIMRRAIRHGVKIDLNEPFLWKVANKVVEIMNSAYPDLSEGRETLETVARLEEERFRQTLDSGLKLLQETIDKLKKKNEQTIPGDTAFQLYDTYGFPVDLTQVIANEQGLHVDLTGYEAAMEEQRARGRASWQGATESGLEGIEIASDESTAASRLLGVQPGGDTDPNKEAVRSALTETLEKAGLSDLSEDYFRWATGLPFPNYNLTARSKVLMLASLGKEGRPESELSEGSTGGLISWWTPFYAESGGQVGDRGWITNDRGGTFEVQDTQYLEGKIPIHLGRVVAGTFEAGDVIEMKVDPDHRMPTRLHHSSTHLVHAALRNHLGQHVKQAGSLVAPDRLRFDFSHYEQPDKKTLRKIEDEVNEQIWKRLRAEHQEMSYEDAMSAGALAFFGEKYGDRVRVLKLGDYSIELCGGTHVENTGEIGLFRLVTEEGIAAGTRRIEALAGPAALHFDQHTEDLLGRASSMLNVKTEDVPDRLQRVLDENKKLLKEMERLQSKIAEAGAASLVDQAREVNGFQVLATEVEGDPKNLREMANNLRTKLGQGVVVLGLRASGKVSLVAAVTKDLTDRVNASALIKELAPIVGGRGGGKPDLAQAGGGDQPDKLPAALEKVFDLVAGAAS